MLPRKKRKFLWRKDSVDEILDWMGANCLPAIRSVTKEIAEAIKETFFAREDQVTVVVIQTKFQNLRKQYKAAGEILSGQRPIPQQHLIQHAAAAASQDDSPTNGTGTPKPEPVSRKEAALKECPYYFKMHALNQRYEFQLKAQDAHLYQSSAHLHLSHVKRMAKEEAAAAAATTPPTTNTTPIQNTYLPHQPPANHQQHPPRNQYYQLPPPANLASTPTPTPATTQPSAAPSTARYNPIPVSATTLLTAAQKILPSYRPPKRPYDDYHPASYLPAPPTPSDTPANQPPQSALASPNQQQTLLPSVHSFDAFRKQPQPPAQKHVLPPLSAGPSPSTSASSTLASSSNLVSPSHRNAQPHAMSTPVSPVAGSVQSSRSSLSSASSRPSSRQGSRHVSPSLKNAALGAVSDPPLSSLRGTPYHPNTAANPDSSALVLPPLYTRSTSNGPLAPLYSGNATSTPTSTASQQSNPPPPPSLSASDVEYLWNTVHLLRNEVRELRERVDKGQSFAAAAAAGVSTIADAAAAVMGGTT